MTLSDLDFREAEASESSTKTKFFFQLLRASYGADVVARKWPTTKDLQLVMALKREAIENLSIEEIRGSIDNAAQQRAKGLDEFIFLDVDIIISGAKRYANGSHRIMLSGPEETPEQKAENRQVGAGYISMLKSVFGDAK